MPVRFTYKCLKGRSLHAFAIVIYLSQLMGCMRFSIVVTIAPCEHYLLRYKMSVAIVLCEQPLTVEVVEVLVTP